MRIENRGDFDAKLTHAIEMTREERVRCEAGESTHGFDQQYSYILEQPERVSARLGDQTDSTVICESVASIVKDGWSPDYALGTLLCELESYWRNRIPEALSL